jgi:hypothetical protein
VNGGSKNSVGDGRRSAGRDHLAVTLGRLADAHAGDDNIHHCTVAHLWDGGRAVGGKCGTQDQLRGRTRTVLITQREDGQPARAEVLL